MYSDTASNTDTEMFRMWNVGIKEKELWARRGSSNFHLDESWEVTVSTWPRHTPQEQEGFA